MHDELRIITTSDGSSSLLNTTLNETYHSTHGAIQESSHVFIKNGLQYFIEKNNPASVSVFEVGFGTGLNALLAFVLSEKNNTQIEYTSIEAFPVDWELASHLNYPVQLGGNELPTYFQLLHQTEWNIKIEITACFSLQKVKTTIQDFDFPAHQFDVVFFDAFAPAKQPEMWTLPVLEKICSAMKSKGVFVTYCAKGQLKRDLRSLGMLMETLPGPPGKREMVRALKP